ncbi:hypothetical protein NM688_g6522 [Phlebia brevispora]|uniref:Uncharacterized protein n=1 Tax=Phlebia brevispora TaxID=194682 RepID=A0ACC1SFH1_9APHY|nr:hypothetical protein NM688_g6522 [Phlebia brevispora]
MMIKLSPEAYLRYAVEISPTAPGRDSSSSLASSAQVANLQLVNDELAQLRFEFVKFFRSNSQFTEGLRTARYHTLNVDVERTARSDSNILDKYCMPVAEVANAVMLRDDVPELRVVRGAVSHCKTGYFVIGDQANIALEPDGRTWHIPGTRGHRPARSEEILDWTVNKKCLAIVVFMHPGELSPDDLQSGDGDSLCRRSPKVNACFAPMVHAVRKTTVVFGILTDESTSFVVDFSTHFFLPVSIPRLAVISTSKMELRFLLALCIYVEANFWHLTHLYAYHPPMVVQGALNNQDLLDTGQNSNRLDKHRKWFSDFDLYAMQRVPELWFRFSLWRRHAQEEGLKHPITIGMSITLEPGTFARQHGLLRSPYPCHELPENTINSIFGPEGRRPRNVILDGYVSSSAPVAIRITQPLYDERYFPIPDMYDAECTMGPPRMRLGALNFPEDLARREESVYDRLSWLQGQSLWDVYQSPLTDEVQTTLITQIRHGVRALRAAGITQTDWHADQILCLGDERNLRIVFIDFALCWNGILEPQRNSFTSIGCLHWNLSTKAVLVYGGTAEHAKKSVAMGCELSPEAYLRLSVPVLPIEPRVPTSSKLHSPHHDCLQRKFRAYQFPGATAFSKGLRSMRYNTFDVDVDRIIHSTDVLDKYCHPVLEVAHAIILKPHVPKLRMLRSEYKGCPTGIFVVSTQKDFLSLNTDPGDVRTWHKPSLASSPSPPDEFPDWSTNRKCLTIVMFLRPGDIDPEDVQIDADGRFRTANLALCDAFATLINIIQETKAAFGILTDELTTIAVDFCYPWTSQKAIPTLSIVPASKMELSFLIAFCIYMEAKPWRLTSLSGLSPFLPLANLNCGLSSSPWRETVQEEGLAHPILPGTSITFEPGGFARRHSLLRSPFPLHESPQDTLANIFGNRGRRPRSTAIDNIINTSAAATVKITQAVMGCDEVVCIKLFDERYFPIPDEDDVECVMGPPYARLCSLNYSEDLARREESIYDRLSFFQGALLPHCYGFHLFTLPDGWQCFGVVMERIEGPSLKDVYNSAPPPSSSLQEAVITQVRHGIRALRAGGVSQTDWHPDQVLCLTDECGVHVVFIDFAFCQMYLGEDTGFPPTDDLDDGWYMFTHTLDVDEAVVDRHWLPPLEFEY